MKESAPYSKDVYLALHESSFSRQVGGGLSEESLAELQLLVNQQRLPPRRKASAEEEAEEAPSPPSHPKRGGGDWKSQPKARLVLGERERLQRRIEQSGLHRTAQQLGVAHATLTRAQKGDALVQEKIDAIRAGLRRAAIPKPPRAPRKKPTGEPLSPAEQQALGVLVEDAAALSRLKRSSSLSEVSLRHAARGGNLLRPNLAKIRAAMKAG